MCSLGGLLPRTRLLRSCRCCGLVIRCVSYAKQSPLASRAAPRGSSQEAASHVNCAPTTAGPVALLRGAAAAHLKSLCRDFVCGRGGKGPLRFSPTVKVKVLRSFQRSSLISPGQIAVAFDSTYLLVLAIMIGWYYA